MSTSYRVNPHPKPLLTVLDIPGDKSISHRAVIFGALAKNTSSFTHFLTAEDCLNTVQIFKALGVPIQLDEQQKTLTIHGVGLRGLKVPSTPLDTGNSGTGIRLITGLLAAQPFASTISGDHSIENRPMKRIIDPLSQMGATITGVEKPERQNIFPPLTITPAKKISGITYTLPVASAQVKSAILLAGLYAQEKTTIIEPEKCRDHTERLLQYYGASITTQGNALTLTPPTTLSNPSPTPLPIPSDISSAAFFIVLALLRPNTEIIMHNIGLNPTRAAIVDMLQKMGGNIQITPATGHTLEPMGTLSVRTSPLQNCTLNPEWIPFLIDEIPILAIACLLSKGTFTLTGAEELRVKESDRIKSIVHMVQAFGCTITETKDGFILPGNQSIQPFVVDSFGDHRIAMSAIIASLATGAPGTIKNTACINTSFPSFFDLIYPFTKEAV